MGGLVIIGQIHRKLAFSTTTPLAANAVYTSPTIDGINYKIWNISTVSDVAGGYVRQHSDDGVTWVSEANAATTANTLAATQVPVYRKYTRIVYTNGVAAQTSFNMSVYLSPL